jgi:RHS repeat-associated protein
VYDSKGRLQDATMNADAASFVVSQTYDSTTGLLDAVTYPTSTSAVPGSRFKVKYEYAYGMTKRVVDFNSPATVYWEEIATNAVGQSIDEVYGNGLHTYSTFDSISGLLGARTTGPTAAIQNLTFQWDKVGNLTQRKDLTLGLTEDFQYDNLYRLTSSTLNGVNNLSVAYDALGNITSKGGVGAYTYPASGASSVRPHAVTTAGSNAYTYDANGNMNARNGSTITWYSYNLPNRIDQGSSYSQFFYGASRARYKQVAVTAPGGSLPAGTETTMYVGGLYERVTKPSGVVEHKHYILAGKEAVALRTLRSNSINDTRYLHYDHLGSLSVVTNEAGAVVLQLSYDALGKRRGATAWSGAPAAGNWTSIAAITHRGFTFHEQLDNVDLIHMNGRVYDPNIGRFISADPFVQAPLMSQSLNRYSYVMNNPLSLVDPSGYSALSKFFKKLRRHIHAGLRFLVSPTPKNFFETVKSSPGQDKIDRFILSHDWAYKAGYAIAVVSSFWIGGYGGAVYQAYYTYIATGSTTRAVVAGILVAAQQYVGNYMSTGSGFTMPSSGGGPIVLSWEGSGAAAGGGVNAINIFVGAYGSAPARPIPIKASMNGGPGMPIPDLVAHIHASDLNPMQKYAALNDLSDAVTQLADTVSTLSDRAVGLFLDANGEDPNYAVNYRNRLFEALTTDASLARVGAQFYLVQIKGSVLSNSKVKPPTSVLGGLSVLRSGWGAGKAIYDSRGGGNSIQFEMCPSRGCAAID